jgi:hypothetical protein
LKSSFCSYNFSNCAAAENLPMLVKSCEISMFDEPLVCCIPQVGQGPKFPIANAQLKKNQAYANGASTERAKEDLGQADRNGSIAAFNPSG